MYIYTYMFIYIIHVYICIYLKSYLCMYIYGNIIYIYTYRQHNMELDPMQERHESGTNEGLTWDTHWNTKSPHEVPIVLVWHRPAWQCMAGAQLWPGIWELLVRPNQVEDSGSFRTACCFIHV